MRITYDATVDALAVELAPEGRTARSVKLGPGITADLDTNGRLIAVEVLDASEVYPRAALEGLSSPDVWLTLAAAAAESGLAHATLRKLIQLERFPKEGIRKHGRDWELSRRALVNYLERREPRGRQAVRRKGRRPRAAARA